MGHSSFYISHSFTLFHKYWVFITQMSTFPRVIKPNKSTCVGKIFKAIIFIKFLLKVYFCCGPGTIWWEKMESDMLKMMLLSVKIGLINLQLRHIASVTPSKASDYFGDHVFPLFFCLSAWFWSMFHLVWQTPGGTRTAISFVGHLRPWRVAM